MILSALLCVAAPLSFAPQHVGQDYVLRQHQDFSSDVITLKEGADANTPLGFATLAMTLGMDADTDSDLLVMRLDQDYNVIWKRQIGGPQNEYSRNLVQTQDGGILVSAFSHSTPVITQRAVLVKFDALGNLMWERCYPGEDIPGVEAGVAVTELDNGNLLMVSNVRGEMDGSLDAVVILTDPGGIPISIWRHGTFENLPVRLIYKSLDSRGQEAVACGVFQKVYPDGTVTTNTVAAKLSDLCGCGLWVNEYPVSNTLPDWGNEIKWAEDGSLLLAGIKGPFLQPTDGYSMRLDSLSGVHLVTMTYSGLLLSDVVEFIDPNTDPTQGQLCFAGWKLREPDPFGIIGFDSALMLTDSHGIPTISRWYDPEPYGLAVSLVPFHQAQGYPISGYFALSTSFSTDYVAPAHQHWIHTDDHIKAGCLEEEYEQPWWEVNVDPRGIDLWTAAMDGMVDLHWDPTDPDLEVVDICEEDEDLLVPICFGDDTGTLCPCGNTGGPGEGCANSTGLGAVLAGTGTPSVAADTLVLSITQGKPGQPVLFFQGINFINSGLGNVFGDGLRCCGGSVRRLQVRFMDAAGAADTTATLSVRGAVAVGSTYCNQAWYRDPSAAGGSPCSTFFNTSSALSVTWTP